MCTIRTKHFEEIPKIKHDQNKEYRLKDMSLSLIDISINLYTLPRIVVFVISVSLSDQVCIKNGLVVSTPIKPFEKETKCLVILRDEKHQPTHI